MNTLHKFAALTLSAVLSVCLLAGCGASASSTASSAVRCRFLRGFFCGRF